MHILFILDFYKPHLGGSETVFFNIIERLIKKWYTIDIITCKFDKKLSAVEKNGNLTVHRVGSNRKNFMFYAYFYWRRLLKSHPSIQIIHSTTYAAAIPSSFLSLYSKKPVLLTVHEVFWKLRNLYKPFPTNLIYQLYEKLIFTLKYNYFHCVSIYTLNSLRLLYGINDKKMEVLHNWIDPSRSPSILDQTLLQTTSKKFNLTAFKFNLLYYGHSWKSKGLDYLIMSLPLLVKNHPQLQVIINLIDSNRDKEMKNKIKALNLASNVLLLDWLPENELKHLVASVNAVIAPSLSEWFGSVHTETVSMWTNLITTQIWPLPEVLRWPVHRIQPQSSESIISVIWDLITWKQATKIPAKTFDWNSTVSKLEEIYKKLHNKQI